MRASAFVRRAAASAAIVGVLVIALAAGCLAASFSADITMKSQAFSQSGKQYVDGSKSRMEMSTGGMNMVTIVRQDKGVVWMLMPSQKAYMESRQNNDDWNNPNWEKQMEKKATKKHLGKAKVAGYTCDKYLFTFKDKSMGTSTVWVAQKLKHPVRVESKSAQGNMTMELKNIKEGKQKASLFEIPKGYKKTTMPSAPPMGNMPKPPARPR